MYGRSKAVGRKPGKSKTTGPSMDDGCEMRSLMSLDAVLGMCFDAAIVQNMVCM